MTRNVELLSLLVSTGMFFIWLMYLQLFYRTYRLALRPNLLIHQAAGFGLDSMCMVANMSQSNVHIAALLVDAERDGDTVTFIPAPRSPDPHASKDPTGQVHLGPLPQGQYFVVGTFRSLIVEAERRLARAEDGEALRLTVRVATFVGSQLRPAGARRTFDVTSPNAPSAKDRDVRPSETLPEQLSTRRQREVVQRWLEEARAMDAAHVAAYSEDDETVRRIMEEQNARTR